MQNARLNCIWPCAVMAATGGNGAYFIRLPCARANGWGGLKAQMLLLAQGNALGWAYALINTFGILAVQPPKCHAPLARNLVRDYFLFVTRFLRVAFLSRRLKNAECINRCKLTPELCPGLWAAIGLSARLNNRVVPPFFFISFSFPSP